MQKTAMLVACIYAGLTWAETPVERGEYLTNLLNCGYCHTPGALLGEPDYGRHLAGSSLGLAYTAFQTPDRPAIVFPGNLTSDKETGIGNWSDDYIAAVIQTGVGEDGRQHVPVMPWPGYAMLKDADVDAIVAYLRSLAPVRFEIPENTAEGTVTEHGWVRFSVFRFNAEDPSVITRFSTCVS